MNMKDEKKIDKSILCLGNNVRYFSSFSLSPAKAYEKKNSEFGFYSLLLPAFTYIFFAIQIVLDRFSFIPTMSAIKACLTVFISMIVGVGMSLISSGLLYSVLTLKSSKADFQCLLLCSNLSYIIPLIVAFIGLVIHLVFNVPTTVTFGISAILFTLVPYGRLAKNILSGSTVWYLFTLCANGIFNVFAVNIILFSVN